MNDTVLTVLFVLGITAALSFFSMQKKKESWEGTVVKKKHFSDSENSSDTYTLIFKTTEGKKKKISINQAFYDSFDVGDKVKKVSGEYLPHKI